ncbi:melanocortin-2 receptor accessory protein isoform c, partial [Daubentonia madagascariensis]
TAPSTTKHAPGLTASTSPSASGGTYHTTGPHRGPHRLLQARWRTQGAELALTSGCSRRAPQPHPPGPPRPNPLSSGSWPLMGVPKASADSRSKPSQPPPETKPLNCRT